MSEAVAASYNFSLWAGNRNMTKKHECNQAVKSETINIWIGKLKDILANIQTTWNINTQYHNWSELVDPLSSFISSLYCVKFYPNFCK